MSKKTDGPKRRTDRPRITAYMDEGPIFDFYVEHAKRAGVAPSSIAAQLLSLLAQRPDAYALLTQPEGFFRPLELDPCFFAATLRSAPQPSATLPHSPPPSAPEISRDPPHHPAPVRSHLSSSIGSSIHHPEDKSASSSQLVVEDVEDPAIDERVEELAVALAAPPEFSVDSKLDDPTLAVVIALELMAAESKKGGDRDKLRSLARHVRRRGELTDKQRAMLHEITARTREWCMTAASPRPPETGACLGAIDWIRKEHEGGPTYAKRWATYLSKEKRARRSA